MGSDILAVLGPLLVLWLIIEAGGVVYKRRVAQRRATARAAFERWLRDPVESPQPGAIVPYWPPAFTPPPLGWVGLMLNAQLEAHKSQLALSQLAAQERSSLAQLQAAHPQWPYASNAIAPATIAPNQMLEVAKGVYVPVHDPFGPAPVLRSSTTPSPEPEP
jgi:hypothetical protein